MMTEKDAANLLATHSGHMEGPRLKDGIAAMLRPYHGIIERNLHEVIECLFILHKSLQSESIDTVVPLAVITILSKIRQRAIEPEGMLPRNELIADNDVVKLRLWINIIETVTIRYMSGKSHGLSLSPYVEYLLAQHDHPQICIELLTAVIADSLLQRDEYKVDGIQLAIQYPEVGAAFWDRIGSLNRSEVEPEVVAVIDAYQARNWKT